MRMSSDPPLKALSRFKLCCVGLICPAVPFVTSPSPLPAAIFSTDTLPHAPCKLLAHPGKGDLEHLLPLKNENTATAQSPSVIVPGFHLPSPQRLENTHSSCPSPASSSLEQKMPWWRQQLGRDFPGLMAMSKPHLSYFIQGIGC